MEVKSLILFLMAVICLPSETECDAFRTRLWSPFTNNTAILKEIDTAGRHMGSLISYKKKLRADTPQTRQLQVLVDCWTDFVKANLPERIQDFLKINDIVPENLNPGFKTDVKNLMANLNRINTEDLGVLKTNVDSSFHGYSISVVNYVYALFVTCFDKTVLDGDLSEDLRKNEDPIFVSEKWIDYFGPDDYPIFKHIMKKTIGVFKDAKLIMPMDMNKCGNLLGKLLAAEAKDHTDKQPSAALIYLIENYNRFEKYMNANDEAIFGSGTFVLTPTRRQFLVNMIGYLRDKFTEPKFFNRPAKDYKSNDDLRKKVNLINKDPERYMNFSNKTLYPDEKWQDVEDLIVSFVTRYESAIITDEAQKVFLKDQFEIVDVCDQLNDDTILPQDNREVLMNFLNLFGQPLILTQTPPDRIHKKRVSFTQFIDKILHDQRGSRGDAYRKPLYSMLEHWYDQSETSVWRLDFIDERQIPRIKFLVKNMIERPRKRARFEFI